ncbi:MAG: hypothetical protein J5911_03360 [Clostridia bacterium]|nr:hypothetical protein [Clostridia bacterium]
MTGTVFKKGLNGNALKIIALAAMTVDHIGMLFFPYSVVFRIIGRLAMPIFAFMIAEGCTYSKHRVKYFALVFGIGVICVAGYLIAEGELYLNILLTFSLSIVIIYGLDYAARVKRTSAYLLPALFVVVSAFLNYALPKIANDPELTLDYGFFGTLLPVAIYVFKDFRLKLVALALILTLIAFDIGWVEWWGYLALVLLAFYDGTRGKLNLKYLFYLYYPLHFVVIYAIYLLV